MAREQLVSRVDQVVALLRQGIIEGRWRGTLPGRQRLANQLGCSQGTVETALRQLAQKGWLVSQGRGRRRRIEIPAGQQRAVRQVKRVRLLLYDKPATARAEEITLLARLLEAGYAADFAVKSQQDLKMDVGRVARFVEKTPCDVWIVSMGSREILQWFSQQSVPAMALFGRFTGLPIAATCPRNVPAMQTAVRRLVELGHRRIVMTTNAERISPYPALFEQAFLDKLKRWDVPAGPYNLAAVEAHRGGVSNCLDSLFQLTPPSALIVTDAEHFLATQQFLARRGLKVPEDVSLISTDYITEYFWCDPPISHFKWEPAPLVRSILRWVDRVVQGKRDIRQQLYDAEFVEGGTIGPAKK